MTFGDGPRISLLGVLLALCVSAAAGPLDEMSLERWSKLREVERYQMQIAEKFCKQQNWKAAAAEYEKYITLYEKSEGASYAQLRWALCQVHLRKANTAIKDGFQTVLDYWPDSADAAKARYHIGRTYLDMGRLDQAKKAYQALLSDAPLGKKPADDVDRLRHLSAAHALSDLAEIAGVQKDEQAQAECWKKLTFDVDRSEATAELCRRAAKSYTQWCFAQEAFDEGVRAMETAYVKGDLTLRVANYVCQIVSHLSRDEQTLAKAHRLADRAAAWLRRQGPQDNQPQKDQDKEVLRRVLQAVADVHASARQERQTGEVYDEIIRRCGASDATLARLAAWHESRDRFDKACSVYRQFKDKAAGLAHVAGGCRKRKMYPAAIAAYRQILSLEDADEAKWTAEIAGVHREARQYPDAIKVYRELMKIAPAKTPEWLWEIGTTHRDAGQYREAIGVLRQCTNFPSNLQVMAWCHRRLKEYNEALLLYNQIASDDRYAPWANLEIGMTWEEAGKKENAIKAFQSVCRRFPKSSHASTAHSRLQSVYKINMTLGGSTDE